MTGWSPVLSVASREELTAEWRVAVTHSGLLTLDEEVALEATGRRIELRGW